MLASLAGKPLIGRKQEEEAIRDQEEILRTAREIQGYRKKLTAVSYTHLLSQPAEYEYPSDMVFSIADFAGKVKHRAITLVRKTMHQVCSLLLTNV